MSAPIVPPTIHEPAFGFKKENGKWYFYKHAITMDSGRIIEAHSDKPILDCIKDGYLNLVSYTIPMSKVESVFSELVQIKTED